jgi:hypothetical protein
LPLAVKRADHVVGQFWRIQGAWHDGVGILNVLSLDTK